MTGEERGIDIKAIEEHIRGILKALGEEGDRGYVQQDL